MSKKKVPTVREAYFTFGRLQFARLLFRLRLAVMATIPTVFWVGVGVLYIRADQNGLGLLVAVPAALWALLTLPHVIFEASIILDAVGYLFTRRARVFQWLKSLPAPDEESREVKGARRIALLVSIVGLTSPLNALAFWCYGVLIRAPGLAHARSVKKHERKLAPATVQISGRTYVRRELLRRFSDATHEELAFV